MMEQYDWEITIIVPAGATDEQRDAIFTAVADAAYDAEPDERNWDIQVQASAVVPESGQVEDDEVLPPPPIRYNPKIGEDFRKRC